jgi:hypothetical protein
MARILSAVIACICAVSAQGIEVSIVGDDDWGVEVGLSETDALRVHMIIGADDGNVAFMNLFFDASPLNDSDTAGYEVVDAVFRMERNDGDPWYRAVRPWEPDPIPSNIERFAGIYADDDRVAIGTDGPWEGDVDHIIIHGNEIGEYALYFENRSTVDPGHAARPPQLFDKDNNQHLYVNNLDIPGFVHFRNAWKDGPIFDRAFHVIVVPEPASFALLLIGAGVARGRLKRRL